MAAAAAVAARQPAAKRAPAMPFPDLPRFTGTNAPLFWRAAWLQDLAKLQAIRGLTRQKSFQRMSKPLRLAIFEGEKHIESEAKKSLQDLIDCGGILYAWLPEGGAA